MSGSPRSTTSSTAGAVSVVGDLAHLDQTRDVAEQVNRLGRMDAVIHNAGVYTGPDDPAGQRRRAVPAHRPDPPPDGGWST